MNFQYTNPRTSQPATPLARLTGDAAHRYESLTGLLLREGTTPTRGFGDYMSVGSDDSHGSVDGDGVVRRRGARCRFLGCVCRYDSVRAILLGLTGIFGLGATLGFIFPSAPPDGGDGDGNSELPPGIATWDIISNMLGYTYFLSWTLSFYPQIMTNYK